MSVVRLMRALVTAPAVALRKPEIEPREKLEVKRLVEDAVVEKRLVEVALVRVAEDADRTPTDAEDEYRFVLVALVRVEFVLNKFVLVALVADKFDVNKLVLVALVVVLLVAVNVVSVVSPAMFAVPVAVKFDAVILPSK